MQFFVLPSFSNKSLLLLLLLLSFTGPFLLGPVFFRTALPCSGGYHMERGTMLLHDAVGINSKNCATTEYQGADDKYMG